MPIFTEATTLRKVPQGKDASGFFSPY